MRAHRPARAGTLILVAVLGLGLAACGGHQATPPAAGKLAPRSASSEAGGALPPAGRGIAGGGQAGQPSQAGQVGQAVKPAGEDIVQTGQVALRVKRHGVRTAFGQVGTLADRFGGYLASSRLHTVGKAPDATVTVRVPHQRVDQLLASLSKLGRVTSQHLTGTDVTSTVVDTQAELTNLKSEEVALRGLLTKAGSITQILQVQEQLFTVEGQVQQLSAQQSSLLGRVTYATISVAITQPPAPAAPRRSLLSRGWSLATSNVVSALRAVVLAIAWAAPFWLLGLLGTGVWVLWRRRRGFAARAAEPEP